MWRNATLGLLLQPLRYGNHYRQQEMPDVFNKTKPKPGCTDENRKSYATQLTYEGYLRKYILPRWRCLD